MFNRKSKEEDKQKAIDNLVSMEKELIYNDGGLAGRTVEVNMVIRAYTSAARYFEENMAQLYKDKAKSSKQLSILFCCILVLAIVAIVLLTPLKTVQTQIIRVDKNSGYVDLMKPDQSVKDSPDTLEDKRNINNYILFRESYNWATQNSAYKYVQLTSYSDVFTDYKNFQLSDKGYVSQMGKNQQLETVVNGFVFMPNTQEDVFKDSKSVRTYQVRFTKRRLDGDGNPVIGSAPTHWVSTISIDYKNPATTSGDQWVNPRGFGVHAYIKSQEFNGG
jgi:type IV secretion system protein VirB8